MSRSRQSRVGQRCEPPRRSAWHGECYAPGYAADDRARAAEAKDARGYLEDALLQEKLAEAEAFFAKAQPQVDEDAKRDLRARIERLRRGLAVRAHFAVRASDSPRKLVAERASDVFGAPVAEAAISRLDAGARLVEVASVGTWSAVAPDGLDRKASLSDVIGWVRTSELIDAATFEQKQQRQIREDARLKATRSATARRWGYKGGCEDLPAPTGWPSYRSISGHEVLAMVPFESVRHMSVDDLRTFGAGLAFMAWCSYGAGWSVRVVDEQDRNIIKCKLGNPSAQRAAQAVKCIVD